MTDRASILRYARRDWAGLAQSKATYWQRWKHRHGAAGGIRIADDLRRQVLALRADWPPPAERRDDLRAHVRVTEALRRVPPRRR